MVASLRSAAVALVAGAAAAQSSRVTPRASSTWNVEYHIEGALDYKIVNVTAGGQTFTYVLSHRGSPIPTEAQLAAVGVQSAGILQIPLQKAALLSTTQIQWAELLGVRSTIAAVPGISYVSSSCVHSMLASGAAVDAISTDDGWSTNMTALTGVDAVFCTPGWGCPGTAVDVAFPDSYETTLAGVSEMVLFMSLFYDAEATANALVRNVRNRLECTRAVASDAAVVRAAAAARVGRPAPSKPRVLWAYYYDGGWYVGTCPNYYCEAVTAAGGEMVVPDVAGTGAWGAYTDDQMSELVARADVWLYASDNWDSTMAPALAGGASPIRSVLQAAPAVTGAPKAVFDFMRRGTNAWFEERPAQPDLLVQDLMAILAPDAFRLTGARAANGRPGSATHARYWWRNVFTESTAAPSTECADVAARERLASDECRPRGSASPLPSVSRSVRPTSSNSRSKAPSKSASRKAIRGSPSRPASKTRKAGARK